MIQQLIINGIISGSIYALIALGFVVIYRTIKFFHFAHGIVYAVGAYLAYTLFILLGIDLIISFFLAITIAALLGITIDRFVYYPLRKYNAPNLVYLIASFGVFIFLQNLAGQRTLIRTHSQLSSFEKVESRPKEMRHFVVEDRGSRCQTRSQVIRFCQEIFQLLIDALVSL